MIRRGVSNLRQFGYVHCDESSILTDEIYSQMFRSMLNQNMGHSPAADKEIKALIKEIDGVR